MLTAIKHKLTELVEDAGSVEACVLQNDRVVAYARAGLDKDVVNYVSNEGAQDTWHQQVQAAQMQTAQRIRIALFRLATEVVDR